MKGGGNSSIDVSALLQEMLITMMCYESHSPNKILMVVYGDNIV